MNHWNILRLFHYLCDLFLVDAVLTALLEMQDFLLRVMGVSDPIYEASYAFLVRFGRPFKHHEFEAVDLSGVIFG